MFLAWLNVERSCLELNLFQMNTIVELVSKHSYLITGFVLVLITVLSLSPLENLPEAPGSDKTHHLVAYFALAFPLALKGGSKWFLLLPVFIFWGGAIELIQPFVNRYGEWLDFVANSIGVLLGVAIRRLYT